MRGLILLFFSSLGLESYSQTNETYTKFIENNQKISWAAEYKSIVNITPLTNTVSLKKHYLDKIKTSGLKTYMITDRKKTDSSLLVNTALTRQEWLKDHYVRPSDNPENWEYRNKKAYSGYRISGLSDQSCCGCDEANAFLVNQILLYSNSRLSTRNIFLSPLCARQTVEDRASWYPLGKFAWNTSATQSSASTYLTKTSVTYPIDPRDSSYDVDILTLGEEMLMNHLFADIKAGKVTAHDVDTDKRISYNQLLTWKMPYDTVAVYDDSSFEVVSYRVIQRVLEASEFKALRVEQAWYYDFKTDRLFSEVLSATLLLNKYMPDGQFIGVIPFVRLRFK